jgi:hypothetical protein
LSHPTNPLGVFPIPLFHRQERRKKEKRRREKEKRSSASLSLMHRRAVRRSREGHSRELH